MHATLSLNTHLRTFIYHLFLLHLVFLNVRHLNLNYFFTKKKMMTSHPSFYQIIRKIIEN